ncbi:hypothetical protein Agub_g11979 [Astrephomene gubernaculifera]|uniref:SOUL heme-binding protein n=1 Tax=Astrephomene gubernaculifera TaxID=47775 RepID=A0AAD3DXJ5_9CHLO|nr:hypothetical protein Agub_g11979 [Astrephomene gubernaculifera]
MSTIFGGISVETPKFTVLKQFAGVKGAELRKYAPQVRAEVLYDSAPNDAIMNNLNSPFRVLAGYIFGGNTSRTGEASEKVEMTAPVVMQKGAADSQKIAMTAPVVMQTGPTPTPTTSTSPATAPSPDAASSTPSPASGSDPNPPPAPAPGTQRVMSFIMPSKYSSVADLPLPKDARVKLIEVPERSYAAVTFRGSMSQQVAASREAELRSAAEREGVRLSDDPNAVQYCSYNPPWCLPWLRTNDILIPVAE